MRRKAFNKGFTLIELVMVILLLAVVAAVIIPRIGSVPGMQLEAAAKKVAADIRYAQNAVMANRTSQWVRITFNAASDSYKIYSKTGNVKNPVTQESSFTVQLNQGEYQGITIQGNFSTTFNYPLGNPSPSVGVPLILNRDTASKTISVTPVTGKVTVN